MLTISLVAMLVGCAGTNSGDGRVATNAIFVNDTYVETPSKYLTFEVAGQKFGPFSWLSRPTLNTVSVPSDGRVTTRVTAPAGEFGRINHQFELAGRVQAVIASGLVHFDAAGFNDYFPSQAHIFTVAMDPPSVATKARIYFVTYGIRGGSERWADITAWNRAEYPRNPVLLQKVHVDPTFADALAMAEVDGRIGDQTIGAVDPNPPFGHFLQGHWPIEAGNTYLFIMGIGQTQMYKVPMPSGT